MISGIGKQVYRKSFGYRNIDRSEPLTPDTLTWIASQTKLATSVAVMQIVERGMIGLDDDVRDIIPKLKELKVLIGFEHSDKTDSVTKSPGQPIYTQVEGKITLRWVAHILPNKFMTLR
jgi:CubicO group peptidase (beta-lactamase class C family)